MSFSRTHARPSLAIELAQPWPLAALIVLLVNDHLLKGAGIAPEGKALDAGAKRARRSRATHRA
jgi:hypothetical protein